MNILRQVSHLREQLSLVRADRQLAKETLRVALRRERTLRKENSRLRQALHDAGGGAAPGGRRGYRTIDVPLRAEIVALKAQGRNNSQISRLLGCSRATVSLVVRGKYRPAKA